MNAAAAPELTVTELTLYAGCMPGRPFRDYVHAAAGAGFTAITMWPNIWFRAQRREGLTPREMKLLADDHGVRITDLDPLGDWLPTPSAGTAPGPMRNEMTRHDYFEFAAALGASTIIAVDLVGAPVDVDAAAAGFASLCQDAGQHGLRVALEPVVFTEIRDLGTGWEIVSRAGQDNSGIVVDVAHHVRCGRDDDALRAIPPDRIVAVQLCDGPAVAPPDLYDEALFRRMFPGEGEMPVVELLRLMGEMGVHAAIGPEMYNATWEREPASAVAARLMASVRQVLSEAGAHG